MAMAEAGGLCIAPAHFTFLQAEAERRTGCTQVVGGFLPRPSPPWEPVPAVYNRRPRGASVRGWLELSTRNAATASRRHGFMVPIRGLRAGGSLPAPASQGEGVQLPWCGCQDVPAASVLDLPP